VVKETLGVPFILKFRTPNVRYIYDVNTNHIIDVEPLVFGLVDYYRCTDSSPNQLRARLPEDHYDSDLDNNDLAAAFGVLSGLHKQHGLLSDHRPTRMNFFRTREEVGHALQHNVNSLILNVTEQCNFRCAYCIFSGAYKYRRTHSNRRMSLETALQAVEFLRNHSDEAEKLSVTFYGGEPLLNYPVIKEVIEYCRSVFNRSVLHSITTNSSLLDEEKIRYFCDRGIYLVISIDGPQEQHNQFRRDAAGHETYERVIRVLERIYQLDPVYYFGHVSFSAVIPHPSWYDDFYEFVINSPLLSHNQFRTSSIEYEYTTLRREDFAKPGFKADFLIPQKQYMNSLLQRYNTPGHLKPVFNDKLRLRLSSFHGRCHHLLGDVAKSNALCLPGGQKLFVNTDGRFGICERVSDFPMGDLAHGIDSEAIWSLIRQYIELSNDCFNCPAVRFCTLCFQHILCEGVDMERKRIFCRYERADFEQTLILYCSILEKNHHALDWLVDLPRTS
jgi:uncharacterized protein